MGVRILVVTDGHFLSHTTRTLEVARCLRELGDDVVFAATGPYSRLLDADGFPRWEIFTMDPVHTMDRTRRSRMDYLDHALLDRKVRADLHVMSQVQPDVVVGDFRWSLSVSSELAGVPYATIINALWTHFYAVRRSVPEGFVLRRLVGERAVAAVGPQLKMVLLRHWGGVWNRYRICHGLPPRPDLVHHMYGQWNLLPDVTSLFPVKPLPPRAHVVGPIFWRRGGSSGDGLPAGLGRNRPVVYVSLGSTATDQLIRILFASFGPAQVDVVFTTGGQSLPEAPPANFTCLDTVSGDEVLPRAVLAVCHGGHGTVYQALSYGVPLLGIATHNDQQWNLDRVEALGVGWRFTQERAQPAQVAACLEQALSDEDLRRRTQALAEEMQRYDGPRNAAEIIHGIPQEQARG